MTEIGKAVGAVVSWFEDGKGHRVGVESGNNTTTYSSADALASAYAGHSEYMPSRIAFLYGSSSSPSKPVPTGVRSVAWDDVKSDYDIASQAFSYAPSLEPDGSNYRCNKVVFHGRTQGLEAGKYIYGACLLGKGMGSDEYNLLAIIDLASDGEYRQAPDGYEFALDWSVKFN